MSCTNGVFLPRQCCRCCRRARGRARSHVHSRASCCVGKKKEGVNTTRKPPGHDMEIIAIFSPAAPESRSDCGHSGMQVAASAVNVCPAPAARHALRNIEADIRNPRYNSPTRPAPPSTHPSMTARCWLDLASQAANHIGLARRAVEVLVRRRAPGVAGERGFSS